MVQAGLWMFTCWGMRVAPLLGGEPSVGNVRDVDAAGVGGHFAVPRGSPPGRDRGPADTDLRPWSGTAERTTLGT